MDNKALQGLAICLLIGLIAGGIVGYVMAPKDTAASPTVDKSAINMSSTDPGKKMALYQDMRKLWSDHVIWTREYIVAFEDGSQGAAQAAERLLKNQVDLGNAIVPYYGKAAGDNLTALLKEHILLAVDILDAAKSGNKTKYADANASWYKNADALATFLSGANPAWKKQDLTDMLYNHLNLTTQEAVAHLQKNYADDVKAFDAVYNEMMGMSDALAAGIIKQFPDKF